MTWWNYWPLFPFSLQQPCRYPTPDDCPKPRGASNALMCIAFFVNNCIALACPLIFINTKSFTVALKRVSSVSKIFAAPLTLLSNPKRSTQVSSVNVTNTGHSYVNKSIAGLSRSGDVSSTSSHARAGDVSSISSWSWHNNGSTSISSSLYGCLRRFLSDRPLLFRSCCVYFWRVDVVLVLLIGSFAITTFGTRLVGKWNAKQT